MALAAIFFTMILVNNYVLVQFLGICPFLGVSKKLDSAFGMSCAVIFVMALATAVTWPIQTYLLTPVNADGTLKWDLGYLQTIVFILVIAVLVQLVEVIMKKFMPPLHKALGVYLPLITTNCAVLGVTVLNGYNLLEGVVYGFATATGFTISIILMAGLREKMEYNDIPKYFQGFPHVLLTAGLMAIAFFGFSGII